ncbi:hypothetical protein MTR_4g126760 [Medicago truncatula]|uniref:Uncharacterized protein n=1 Tax=Medicago truncatula TaxID=3880 RepID=G7JT74_MEDTR|nr:hypothetical protein MTR_4g126760 [Medicago truncatula]
MRRVLYYEEKLTPQSPHLPMYSISSTCSVLFSKILPSLPLQTRKQSLRKLFVSLMKLLIPYISGN